MKQPLVILSVACTLFLLSACGNQSKRRASNSLGIQTAGTDRNIFSGSGMGSSRDAITGSAETTAAQFASVPQLNSDPFKQMGITKISHQQQCADIYNNYARFEGSFERALYDLTTCLNQLMIEQNPVLFQQYQNLYQYQQQNPQYGWGVGIPR